LQQKCEHTEISLNSAALFGKKKKKKESGKEQNEKI
jgi:hypothetical protein